MMQIQHEIFYEEVPPTYLYPHYNNANGDRNIHRIQYNNIQIDEHVSPMCKYLEINYGK